jgi:hypothetical protein
VTWKESPVDPVLNPYSPGAGSRPPALVGRDEQIDNMSVALQRLLLGSSARGQILAPDLAAALRRVLLAMDAERRAADAPAA